MQLSRLEVKGFKSFGDKIVINFDGGITGIVGPNGCGKSNVVDAIRWVLGEQKTRNLRSEKMEDVIFNGTKDKKPHQMAEVSITFNNTKNLLPTEYTHVTVTRRYFRSGDSEYELNGVTCRLKDINDLFLDTGIGSDSYAIIELKMVENLLNDKDGSRRELFEEAAGISKFKIRKKQTLKKLEDTDKDLARVEDLLFEIEKNLKSLEKQAKQAEKYYEIKKEYQALSIELAKLTLAETQNEYVQLAQKITHQSDQKGVVIAKQSLLDAELNKLKTDLINKESLVKSRQKTLNEHVNKIRQHEGDKKIKNERLNFLNENLERLTKQLQIDKSSNDRAETTVKALNDDLETATKLFESKKLNLDLIKNQYEDQKITTSTIQNKLVELNQILKSSQEQFFQQSKKIEINKVQISALKQELEKTSTETNTHHSELESFSEKLNQLEKEFSEKENKWKSLVEHEEQNHKMIVDLDIYITKIKDKSAEISRKLDAKTNEYNLTKSLVDNLEGFPEAVKFLKKNNSWMKDAPLLSDIITCDDQYRVAIENYLDPFMNYFVVDSRDQAAKAIELLSNSSKGKSNFFVLANFLKFNPIIHQNIEKCIPAINIVQFDMRFEKLFTYLLADVYISEGSTVPNDHSNIYISQTGNTISRNYSISGGSVGLFEGKRLGRAKNLEILDKDIKILSEQNLIIKEDITRSQTNLQSLKEKTQKHEIEAITIEINQLNQETVAYRTRKEQLSSLLSKNTGRRDEIIERLGDLEIEVENLQPEIENLQLKIQGSEDQSRTLRSDVDRENAFLIEKSSNYNNENLAFYQLDNKVNSIQKEISYKKSSFDTTSTLIAKNSIDLQKTESDIKDLLNKSDVSDTELRDMYAEKEAIEIGVNEAEKEYYHNRGEIDRVEKESKELNKNKEIIDTLLIELNHKSNENKLKINSVKERLLVEFSVDITEQFENESDIKSIYQPHEISNKVEQLKVNMEKIGPINPMAIETYNEIGDRHKLIVEQKTDILTAKNSLLETISEIDTTAKLNFETAFTSIRENFKKVFRSLFTEDDSCDLVLSDPNNPLESSIDIMARPKGKRPQSINQLSGGEKTLTAISLLFAIYLLKPAPFCIFDEVDAPLDDANIDKFNNIIKKFSETSQFIIVTHNKRTMAYTDIMYGVTMIETGVSRVVPVDLRELV